jgi:hypothetical protein
MNTEQCRANDRLLVDVKAIAFVGDNVKEKVLLVGARWVEVSPGQHFSAWTDLHLEGSPAMRALINCWSFSMMGIAYSEIMKSNIISDPCSCRHFLSGLNEIHQSDPGFDK